MEQAEPNDSIKWKRHTDLSSMRQTANLLRDLVEGKDRVRQKLSPRTFQVPGPTVKGTGKPSCNPSSWGSVATTKNNGWVHIATICLRIVNPNWVSHSLGAEL